MYWGLHSRAVPLGQAVDVLAVVLGEHSGRVGLKSSLCSESCVPGVGLHQWEELIFLIHTKSCVVQWQLCPLSCLLCPQVPRSVCGTRSVCKMKGIQDSSLDLSLLKQLKIILIKKTCE